MNPAHPYAALVPGERFRETYYWWGGGWMCRQALPQPLKAPLLSKFDCEKDITVLST